MSLTAGCRALTLHDGATAFPALVLYPATSPERSERFGPYALDVAMDAAPVGEALPLVVVSHGTGSSHLLFRDLARHLARRGFVVVLLEHPGNNRNDDSRADTFANLVDRPRHVRIAIDRAYADDALGPRLAPNRVALVGHSMGGYTALAVAGGRPTAFAREVPEREPRPVPVARDDRVRALVLLAPAAGWYMAPESLRDVRVPILMLTGEHDVHAIAWHGATIRRALPDEELLAHRVVPNAAHFSFLAPFPPAMTHPGFPPSQDPPGFDRVAFHAEMYAEITEFLTSTLD